MAKESRNSIFTIGYGNYDIETFVKILSKYDVRYIIDIRSAPFSKYNKDFNYDNLREKLNDFGIELVFMGKELGGRPSDDTYYDEGIVLYDKIKDSELFKKGIERLLKAASINCNVALMCSELKPENCHRSKLIGEVLREKDVEVLHIDENGVAQSQQYIINKTIKFQPRLFDDTFTSRKSYKKQ